MLNVAEWKNLKIGQHDAIKFTGSLLKDRPEQLRMQDRPV